MDYLEKQNKLLAKDTAILLKTIEKYKEDSIIFNKKELAYNDIIKNYSASLANSEQNSYKNKKQIKQLKLKNNILSGVVLIFSLIFILK